jgi:imidazolonepropionase
LQHKSNALAKTLLIKNIKSLIGINDKPHSFKKGEAMSILGQLDNAYLLCEDGKIKDFGENDNAPENVDEVIDGSDRFVLPAWCDSHTHIVYAASREKEFVDRIKGKSYEEIAQAGGGILNSARRLRETPEDVLLKSAIERANEIISYGTGAVEIKSGYGLSFESEIKMLRVIQKLKYLVPLEIKSTFLAAHAIPLAYKENRQSYIDLIIEKMLPAVAKENLADYCDVFCDKGFFTVDETDQILKAASKFGLKPKIHANELAISGGVQVGIANGAISVDHLEAIGQEEIDALSHSTTIPTILPSTSFFLNLDYAPARKMIDSGLGVCLASDYNPGSTPSGKIPFILSLACLKMKMLPAEAINAVTINGACAMELQKDYGSITVNKVANLIITNNIPSIDFIPYAFGSNHIDKVILKGEICYKS